MVVCREVLGLGGGSSEGGLGDFRAGNLNQMLWLFLRLLASREAITDTLARIDRRQLEAGLESLKSRVAGAADPEGALARSLRATLEIQEKRLANLDTATNSLAVLDAELERIEQQVRLVREESAVSRSPEALSARLDAVSSTLSETSRWMDQHADLMTDLTSADLDDALPSVPRTPVDAAAEPQRRRARGEDAAAAPAADGSEAEVARWLKASGFRRGPMRCGRCSRPARRASSSFTATSSISCRRRTARAAPTSSGSASS